MNPILVWDWPVRLGHWLMVGGFILAWLTSESETWRLVHVLAGATVGAVAVFRVLWGFVGSRHALFENFVRGPAAVTGYFSALLARRPQHFAGHNPAGAVAILLLLGLGILATLSGWAIYTDLGGHMLEELHEGLAATMLAVVVVHLAGVVSGSLAHRENLVRAMLTGRKLGLPEEAIASARPLMLPVLLAWVGFAGWWLSN
jgi:cytochrome b